MTMLILMIKLRRKKEKEATKRGERRKLSLSLSFSLRGSFVRSCSREHCARSEKCCEKLIFEKFFVCCLGFVCKLKLLVSSYDYIYYLYISSIIIIARRRRRRRRKSPMIFATAFNSRLINSKLVKVMAAAGVVLSKFVPTPR